MHLLAGTSSGIVRLADGESTLVAECGSVREFLRTNDRIYAGSKQGVRISDDDGLTWHSGGLTSTSVWQIRQLGDNKLLAGTQPAGLFTAEITESTTLDWQPVSSFNDAPEAADWCVPVDPPLPAAARALVVDRTNPDRICAGVEVGGIMRTVDGGETWSLVLPGDNPDLHMMFQHPTNPDVLFASTGYGRLDGIAPMIEGNAGIFVSEDFGATWSYRWWGIEPRYSRPMCIDDRADGALTVASAPTAFSNFRQEGGAGAMLFRSNDDGRHWRSLCDDAHSPSAVNFHGLTTDPTAAGGVIVGTDNGEVWQVTGDGTWSQQASDLRAVLALCAWQ